MSMCDTLSYVNIILANFIPRHKHIRTTLKYHPGAILKIFHILPKTYLRLLMLVTFIVLFLDLVFLDVSDLKKKFNLKEFSLGISENRTCVFIRIMMNTIVKSFIMSTDGNRLSRSVTDRSHQLFDNRGDIVLL